MGNYFSSLDHDIRHIEEVINYVSIVPFIHRSPQEDCNYCNPMLQVIYRRD